MRLNNYQLLKKIISLGLPGPIFSNVKNFMCFGEKLKTVEQSLIFLKKCREQRIFPVFILNSFNLSESLYPLGYSNYSNQLLFNLKMQSINQHIKFKYQMIIKLKNDIATIKRSLCTELERSVFNHLLDLFNTNLLETKEQAKVRLCHKFNWLIYKYYTDEWDNWISFDCNRRYQVTVNSHDPRFCPPLAQQPETESVLESADEKVTCISLNDIHLRPEIKELLALGPGFAISPDFRDKNKEKFVQLICDRIAEFAIGLRWSSYFSQIHSVQSQAQYLKSISPFDKKFTKPPPTDDLDLENRLVNFRTEVCKIIQSTVVKQNITSGQRELLHELKNDDNIHISIADKTAEFVVMQKEDHIRATKLHFDHHAYKKVDMPNTEKKATRFIKNLTETLENNINNKWNEICGKRGLSTKIYDLFAAHHTTIPTGRIQIKTHKHPVSDIESIPAEQLKVRPIVANCNSPMDRITFLMCHILKPLLDHIPAHLKNTHDLLVKLQSLPTEQLKGRTFFTADVEALYTNINVETALNNIIEFASEQRKHLTLYGLTLTDIHELMEIALLNSYFVYDRQIYIQLQGFFMGVRPAPLGAIIKMWKLERNSIYSDLRLSHNFYGRFYDDLGSIVVNRRRSERICRAIENEDPDKLIKIIADYPESSEAFTPLLNVEIKIERDGKVSTRLFRKPQKKLLTLNANSHHPTSTKEYTVANMYKTADNIASSTENKQHSKKMVDELLKNNGYQSGVLEDIKTRSKKKKPTMRKNEAKKASTLKMPYLSDQCTAKIKRAAEKYKLPLRVVTTPGLKLKNILTSSKPLDKPQCPNNNCQTCKALKPNSKGRCTDSNVIYHMHCEKKKCQPVNIGHYDGETYRPTHYRFSEHYRAAKNPQAKSYLNNPWAKHYKQHHPGCKDPKIGIEILDRATTTNERKIKEARVILKNNSDLNDKNEQTDLRRFLV